ncbi:hypothetical protein NSS82_19200 [Paenibacillus sp. FSL H7-0735]|uniref:hypothetical protein n=1 Tax=Paenibacillus sp. FSL H7-0735 TaxID=2954736 RepID=UPI0030F70983
MLLNNKYERENEKIKYNNELSLDFIELMRELSLVEQRENKTKEDIILITIITNKLGDLAREIKYVNKKHR